MKNKQRIKAEVNTGSMADIAFLLLIFFLVTTQIINDKGLQIRLPPKVQEQSAVPVKERNVLKIQINSKNKVMLENEILDSLEQLQSKVITFVLNNGLDKNLSESPKKAIVSIKTDRGTEYSTFITVLDQVQGAYYSMRAKKVGLSAQEFRELDTQISGQKEIYEKGKKGIPMQISIAEPSNATIE